MDHMNHGSQQEHERISHKDHETMLHERHEKTVSVSQVRGAQRAASPEPQNHHAMMIADYRRRFWISLVLTIPILLLSPFIHSLLGLSEIFSFNGDMYVLFGLSTIVYFYGGYPFLKGIFSELKEKTPGMPLSRRLKVQRSRSKTSANCRRAPSLAPAVCAGRLSF